jgi:hypothetical protein
MADQFSALELLLDPEDQLADPIKRKATAAALRRQNAYGTLGQLMGVQPTMQAGTAIQEGAQQSLRAALAKQQAAKEAAARKLEREQAQANWQAQMERDQARDAEQRRQFEIQERRLSRPSPSSEERKRFVSAGDGMVLDTFTGAVTMGMPTSTQGQGVGQPRTPGFAAPPPTGYGKQTEAEQKSQFYAQTMSSALPQMVGALASGYTPGRIDQFAAGPQASGIGGKIQANVPRSFGSQAGREFYTAGRQVLAGILRKESGAAITDDEWQNYGPMYLPWPGDSPEEIQRKIQVLHEQAENAARGSGSAYRYWTAPQYLPGEALTGGQQPQGVPTGPPGSSRDNPIVLE